MAELFDETHFFMCSGGMKPARMRTNQSIVKNEKGDYYLTVKSLRCIGLDFCCKWMALLCAVLAAAIALLMSNPAGWVLLAAIAGAAAGALIGGAICADMAAVMRVWVVIKVDAQIDGHQFVANRPGSHLTCNALFSETINYVPNVKSEFHAYCIFAGNIITTGLEGFMYVYAFRGAGMLFKAPMTFVRNFGVNYLASLTVKGAAMRSVFGAYSAFSSYSLSSVEGGDAEQMKEAALDGFFFAERAALRIVSLDYKNPETGEFDYGAMGKDVAMMFSFGGIPAGRNGDAQRGDVGRMGQQVLNQWKHPVQTAKAEVGKMIEAAKEFREKIRRFVNGKGAYENTFDISQYRMEPGEKLGDFAERVVEDMLRGQGYDEFFQVQNRSGNGVDIVARNSLTGDMILAEVKGTQQIRLWDNGNMKDIPMTKDQQTGGESFSESRLERAAEGEDGYTDGRSTIEAQRAQQAIEAAKENGANIEYHKYDVYVDENGIPRTDPQQRP